MDLLKKAHQFIEGKEIERNGNRKNCYFVNIDGNDYALLTYKFNEEDRKKILIRIKETMSLIEQGFHTPLIIDIEFDEDMVYELQRKAKGKTLAYRSIEQAGSIENYVNDLFLSLEILKSAPKSCFLALINDSKIFSENGHSLDCHSDNYVIDENGQFTLIDLDIHHEGVKRDANYFAITNTLPNIFSFFRLKPDMPHYDECISAMRNIAPIWLNVAVDFLVQNGFSTEETKKMVNNINFNYFHITPNEKTSMIENTFGMTGETGVIL